MHLSRLNVLAVPLTWRALSWSLDLRMLTLPPSLRSAVVMAVEPTAAALWRGVLHTDGVAGQGGQGRPLEVWA